MKKITSIKSIMLLLCISFYSSSFYSQVALRELTLEQHVNKSSLVVEGEVISKKSYWDVDHERIYTVNTVEVFKAFKGQPAQTIEVITEGGAVGTIMLYSSSALKLNTGDVGMFALKKNENVQLSQSLGENYKPIGAVQGFYKYNLYNNVAVNPFNKKESIASLYTELKAVTNSDYTELAYFNPKRLSARSTVAKGLLGPGEFTFSPTTTTAGTFSKVVLTVGIDASFGATKGKVQFANAHDGGDTFIEALDSQVEWSDTEIVVEVPSGAGTGKIRVVDEAEDYSESENDITITHNEQYAVFDLGNGPKAYPIQHIGIDGDGGYTWTMQDDFFKDTEFPGAKAAFMRAFNNWICATGINWKIDEVSTLVGDAVFESNPLGANGDPLNIITFDDDGGNNELDDDVLGTCYTWVAGCGTDFYLKELDIVFNNSVENPENPFNQEKWNFGPGPTDVDIETFEGFGDFDFESVVLHELGHGHLLDHVINSEDVMHHSILFNEDNRALTEIDITAGKDIRDRGIGFGVCGVPAMTLLECPTTGFEDTVLSTLKVYPNPAKNQFFIENGASVELESVEIIDISGRLVSKFDLSNNSRLNRIDISSASKGLYFINIHSGNVSVTKKLIIE